MNALLRAALVLPVLSLSLTACGPGLDEQRFDDDELGDDEAALTASQRAAVFTLGNEIDNAVIAYRRAADGTLTLAGSTRTGGAGSGGGLGSQGALAFSDGRRWLFAVNAGSNQISSFEVFGSALVLADVVDSGGERPISLTVRGNRVYVLNAGGAGNITGFTFNWLGRLTPIPHSTRPLSSAASAPAQVELTPDGSMLAVTEKATNKLSTYLVLPDGTTHGPVVSDSIGQTPFGFEFTRSGALVVSEAFGAAAGRSAMSSYRLTGSGSAQVLSGSVPNGQAAACWVVITRDDAYAYTSNAVSGTISGYRVGADGRLALLPDSGRTGLTGDGSRPIDMALSTGSRFLYVVNAGTHTLGAFRVNDNGSLAPIAGASNLPASAVGVVAR